MMTDKLDLVFRGEELMITSHTTDKEDMYECIFDYHYKHISHFYYFVENGEKVDLKKAFGDFIDDVVDCYNGSDANDEQLQRKKAFVDVFGDDKDAAMELQGMMKEINKTDDRPMRTDRFNMVAEALQSEMINWVFDAIMNSDLTLGYRKIAGIELTSADKKRYGICFLYIKKGELMFSDVSDLSFAESITKMDMWTLVHIADNIDEIIADITA